MDRLVPVPKSMSHSPGSTNLWRLSTESRQSRWEVWRHLLTKLVDNAKVGLFCCAYLYVHTNVIRYLYRLFMRDSGF